MSYNNRQRAVLYAAYKHLEGIAKPNDGQCELPAGTSIDVSGEKIVIELPPETIISRELGENGDGRCQKKATQSLYGWAILYAFTYQAERILKKFNQHKRFRRFLKSFITRIVKHALDTGKTSEEAFRATFPEVAKGIDDLKSSINVPMRDEPIPRKTTSRKLPPTFTFETKKVA